MSLVNDLQKLFRFHKRLVDDQRKQCDVCRRDDLAHSFLVLSSGASDAFRFEYLDRGLRPDDTTLAPADQFSFRHSARAFDSDREVLLHPRAVETELVSAFVILEKERLV